MERRKDRVERLLLCGLLLAACAVIAILAWRNAGLRAKLDAQQQALVTPRLGAYVPSTLLPGVDASVAEVSIARGEARIVHVFHPDCPASRASRPALAALAQRLARSSGSKGALVAVARARPAHITAFMREAGIAIPLAASSADLHAALGVRVLPTTLLVDAAGRVRHAHAGPLDAAAVDEILAVEASGWRRSVATMQGKEK